MAVEKVSRRGLLSVAGVTAAAATLPTLSVPASAAASRPRRDAASRSLARLTDLRFGMFNHFNMGTFTDEEWATPNQDPMRFAPTDVNCEQWAAAAAAAKMSYGVLTTKHHDGFCLWPSKYSTYTVAQSSYSRDIVGRYVTAFRARGLKVGLYFSMWDRSHTVQAYDPRHSVGPGEAVQPGDITYILHQLTELLTGYGTIDLLITDGYAWQMGQQAVPYQKIRDLATSLQPDIVLVDIGGLSHPWLGDAIFFEEPLGVTAPDTNTYAGLQGQTISNGWFWHPSTPTESLMSTASILDHLADLEAKWTSLILNCPPNRDGVLDTNVVDRLAEVGAAWTPHQRGPLPPQPLRVEHPVTPVNAYATAFHTGEGPLNAIDGRSDVNFQTCWSTWSLPLPQTITIDLGGVWSNISTLEYLPKQWDRHYLTDGDITSYTISTSTDGVSFTEVATGTWRPDSTTKLAEWPKRAVGFVRVQVHAGTGGYANIAGVHIGGRTARPVLLRRLALNAPAYRLVARHNGKIAEVVGAGSSDGDAIGQAQWRGDDSQTWAFVDAGDGYYQIRNRHSGKLMEVAGLSRAEGGKVGQWRDQKVAQQYWAVTPIEGGYHLLTNRFSGLSLQADEGGTAVNQRTYAGRADQQWLIVPL